MTRPADGREPTPIIGMWTVVLLLAAVVFAVVLFVL